MQMRTPWIAVFFVFSVFCSNVCADESRDAEKSHPLVTLYDATRPQVEREATFAYYQQQALAGKASAQYIVGSLYRVGERLPGNLVKRDSDAARRYLSTAAAHGYLRAMAKMAELELAEKHYLEAMIWAQLYGHYSGAADAIGKGDQENASGGYLADLLRRVLERFDPKQESTARDDMNAFIDAHDAEVRGAAGGMRGFAGTSEMQYKAESQRKHRYNPPQAERRSDKRDVLADYLVAFDGKGDAAQAWLIDALPDIDLGKELKMVAMNLEVNEIAGSDLRYGIVPIDFSWGRYKLRKAK